MQKHKAKKSLGQNFLKSQLALKKIIEAGEILTNDIILEIGPGKGALTEKLLSAISASHKKADREKVGKVIAIEKDHELFEFLKIKFEKEIKNKKLILIQGDILAHPQPFPKGREHYKIIANIPYNITGAILKKFLTEKNQPELMVLMVQNEVAKRIVARDGKESLLSISVKAYGEPKIIMKVPARYFSPAPKVDSAVIVIKNINRKIFTQPIPNPSQREGLNPLSFGEGVGGEARFWQIARAGFAHKRKKLSNNLKKIKNINLEKYKDKRAEELSLENWLELSK